MDIICEAVRGVEIITMIIEEIMIEVKVMIEIGVHH